MEVWGMGADTILQCYCLDVELQGKSGGEGAPGAGSFSKYTPSRLAKFFDIVASENKGDAAKS